MWGPDEEPDARAAKRAYRFVQVRSILVTKGTSRSLSPPVRVLRSLCCFVSQAGLQIFPTNPYMHLLNANFMIDVLGVRQAGLRRVDVS